MSKQVELIEQVELREQDKQMSSSVQANICSNASSNQALSKFRPMKTILQTRSSLSPQTSSCSSLQVSITAWKASLFGRPWPAKIALLRYRVPFPASSAPPTF